MSFRANLHLSIAIAASLLGQTAFAQDPLLPKDARATAGLHRDSKTNRVSLHTRVQWTQPTWFGSLSSVVETTRADSKTRNGRTGFDWRAARKDGGLVKGGAFLLEPLRFSNRTANVGLPTVALRGLQTGFAKGPTTIGAFTGSVIVDEGVRGWKTRKTPDKITGVHVSRAISEDFAIAVEADRMSSGASAQTILRPSFRWNLSKVTALNGEYSAAGGGSPSFHIGIEGENTKVGFNAAYVRRSSRYLAWGPLASFADREGLAGESRFHVARWLDFSAGMSDLRNNVDDRPNGTQQRSRQYSATAAIKLAATTQVILNRQSTGVAQRAWSWRQVTDSATFVHSTGRMSTRVRIDRSNVNAASRTWSAELEQGRDIWRAVLSGRVRWHKNEDVTNPTGRFGASLRASRSAGKRISLAIQMDLARERQVRSLAERRQHNVTASAGVSLSQSSKVHVELYRTAQHLRSSPQARPTATNDHTFLVEYEKAFR